MIYRYMYQLLTGTYSIMLEAKQLTLTLMKNKRSLKKFKFENEG